MPNEPEPYVLSYALTTSPIPVTASPPNVDPGNEDDLSYASIDLVISNSGSRPARCSRIVIVLPVGSLGQELALTGGAVESSVEPADEWMIVEPQPDSSTVRFSVEPRGEVAEVPVDGLYITLKNIAVSNKTGVAQIGIEEWATTGEEIPATPNTGTLEVAKFPFRS